MADTTPAGSADKGTTSAAPATNDGAGAAQNAPAVQDAAVETEPTQVVPDDAENSEAGGKVWTVDPGEVASDERDEAKEAALAAAREDEAFRLANPNRVVYRSADPEGRIGGQSMRVGQVATADAPAQEDAEDTAKKAKKK